MNERLLELAKARTPDKRVLINGAAKRAAELARGARPLVPVHSRDEISYLDIALREIAEGKLQIDVLALTNPATPTLPVL